MSATRGTRTDGVELTWTAGTEAVAALHPYRVIGTDGSTRTSSNVAQGRRAPTPILGYSIQRNGGEWIDVGSSFAFLDDGAPLGTWAAPARTTAKYFPGYTRLAVTAEPTFAPPVPSRYRVRAATLNGDGPPSATAEGFRGHGETIAYQWQRSMGDSDANYSDLPDVTGSVWFDADAPLDAGERWTFAVEVALLRRSQRRSRRVLG